MKNWFFKVDDEEPMPTNKKNDQNKTISDFLFWQRQMFCLVIIIFIIPKKSFLF